MASWRIIGLMAVACAVSTASGGPVTADFAIERSVPRVSARFLPGDPLFGLQWHLRNTVQVPALTNRDVSAAAAWDITQGTASVVIAVLDDGFDLSHPDLAANIFSNRHENTPGLDMDGNGYTNDWRGWDFVQEDNDPSAGVSNNHGTAMAGIAAAAGDNSIGVAGMAYRCSILPVRVASSSVTDQVWARAINYAAGTADVISISYFLPPTAVVYDALNNAIRNGRNGRGCVVLAALGNDGVLRRYSSDAAAAPEVITVSGCTSFDHRSWFADYGAPLSLVAPCGGGGGSLLTTDRAGTNGYNTAADGDYVYIGDVGTSPACPLAAGAAALVISRHPEWTSLEVRRALESTCDRIDAVANRYGDTGAATWYGHGRLNAGAALMYGPGEWDTHEPDDSPAQAAGISDGELQYHSLATGADEDWISFSVSNTNRILLTVLGPTNVSLQLYDSATNLLGGYDPGYPGFSHLATNLLTGTYYARTASFNATAISSYAVHFGIINLPDSHEPDDSTNSAAQVMPGSMQYRTLFPAGDVDWASFHLTNSASTDIMTMGEWNGWIELRLYNATGDLLAYSYTTSVNARITTNLNPGGYYVRVNEKDGYSSSSYQLLLETAAADGYEPNNSSNSATAISPGMRINGTLYPTNDIDWFAFTLSNSANVVVLTDTINPRLDPDDYGDTVIRLYREGETVPLGENDDGNHSRFSALAFYCLPAGRYCIRVTPYAGTYCPDYCVALDAYDAPADVDVLAAATNGVQIGWQGDSSFIYTVQHRDNLAGTQEWAVAGVLTGRIGRTEWTDDGSATGVHPYLATQRFYRILTR